MTPGATTSKTFFTLSQLPSSSRNNTVRGCYKHTKQLKLTQTTTNQYKPAQTSQKKVKWGQKSFWSQPRPAQAVWAGLLFSASTIVDRYRGQLREVKPLRMRSNLEVMLPFEVRGHSEANPGSLGRFVCFLLLCTVGNRYRGQIQEVKPLRKRSNLEVMVLVRLKFILRPT